MSKTKKVKTRFRLPGERQDIRVSLLIKQEEHDFVKNTLCIREDGRVSFNAAIRSLIRDRMPSMDVSGKGE